MNTFLQTSPSSNLEKILDSVFLNVVYALPKRLRNMPSREVAIEGRVTDKRQLLKVVSNISDT